MSYSLTVTESTTFTITYARHMAAKIATDLKRLQRFYGSPNDADITEYEAEAISLMKAGYLDYVWYGFKRNGSWVEPTLRYTAQDLYGGSVDDDPGKIPANGDISGAKFHSFLSYSDAWAKLSSDEKDAFKKTLPYYRTSGTEPTVSGYLANDRTYSSGGRALDRSIVRSL